MGGGAPPEIDFSNAPVLGSAEAPVTVVIYACARCPYCSKLIPLLYEAVADGALQEDARLAFRIFPIRGHEGSTEAGLGFAAAVAMDGFWPFLRRGVPVTLILSMLVWAGVSAATADLFKVREVRVKGCRHTSRSEIIGTLELKPDQHLLSVDLESIRQRLKRHHWIRDAEISRELPDRLIVDVHEQEILGVVNLGADYYVNTEGILFKRIEPGESHDHVLISGLKAADFTDGKPDAFADLSAAVELIKAASACGVNDLERLSEVHFDPVTGFGVVTMDRGIWIALGREGFGEKLVRLTALWDSLGEDAARLKWVDVSVPGRAFIRLSDREEHS